MNLSAFVERILELLNLGKPRCADCDVVLDTVELLTPGQPLDRGVRHYQRCRPCWLAMVRRWNMT